MVVVTFWCNLQSIFLKQLKGGTRDGEGYWLALKGVFIFESPLFMFMRSSSFNILISFFATNVRA